MKLAISNIAWAREENKKVAEILTEMSVNYLEVAPTAIWDQPLTTTDTEIKKYIKFWDDHGVSIIAMQSLLFGKPELTIFKDQAARESTLTYLSDMIQLANRMEIKILVFGSPKNRQTGNINTKEINKIAIDFFGKLAGISRKKGVFFCIEPNPTIYGCDFVTDVSEGVQLVTKINHPNFRLHLDAGEISTETLPINQFLSSAARLAKHFHLSELNLNPPGSANIPHEAYAEILKKAGYNGFVSIEMKQQPDGQNIKRVEESINFARKSYPSV